MTNLTEEETVSFGYTEIPVALKTGRVKGLFSSVAKKYDIMNDALSLGAHRIWKNIFINRLNPRPAEKYLDVAGGTGDIAERIFLASGKKAEVIVYDLTYEMLNAGKNRKFVQAANGAVRHICGDAENLPFKDESFDGVTISFGIRNVTRPENALTEAFRVLRPGGKFMCLEFSEPGDPVLKKIYDAYSFNLIPKLGEIIAGDADSYRYLAESIRKFPNQVKFADMMKNAGFQKVSYQNLSGGIVAIHSGYKYFSR